MDDRKSIVIRVEPDFHKKVKIHATEMGITIQEYLISLIEKDLEREDKRK